MAKADQDALRRHVDVLAQFHGRIGQLLEITVRGDGWYEPAHPRPGRESDWHRLKVEVDRLAAPAARAFEAAGAFMLHSPPGTLNRYPMNPAPAWATIISDHPMFDAATLESVINQAIGSLSDQITHPPPRASAPAKVARAAAPHVPAVAKWVGAIVGPVITAGLVYWFGFK